MRAQVLPFLKTNSLLALQGFLSFVRRVDRPYAQLALPLVGWLVTGFVPLVAFDAGGGQTAIGIVRYVAFRGLDRDVWVAAGTLFVLIGVLAASAVLIGLVLSSVGLLFKDKRLAIWGCAITLASLFLVVIATQPVASVTILGLVALPHIGWWILLIHGGFALCLASQWPAADSKGSGKGAGWNPLRGRERGRRGPSRRLERLR